MRISLRGCVVAVVLLGSGQGTQAEQTVMFPDVNGKMVRISVAHTYEQCRKNGKHLGYPRRRQPRLVHPALRWHDLPIIGSARSATISPPGAALELAPQITSAITN
jgi:hypothetical protein